MIHTASTRSSLPSSTRPPPSITTTQPYALLEHRFAQFIDSQAVSALAEKLTPHPVFTIGGDQLTGKSTLSRHLAAIFSCKPVQSAGSAFRELAKKQGCSVAELSRRAKSVPEIDVEIEYNLCESIAAGIDSLHHLIVEGRQPAVMATYMKQRFHKQNVTRIYLKCSARAQLIRYVEREVGTELAQQIDQQLSHKSYNTLAEVVCDVENLAPAKQFVHLITALRDNDSRDALDRTRYNQLYGSHPVLDYRNSQLYDIVIDTSHNTVQQTGEQALKALADRGLKPVHTVAVKDSGKEAPVIPSKL